MALPVIATRDISLIEIISEHHRRVNRKTPLYFDRLLFQKYLEGNITEQRSSVK